MQSAYSRGNWDLRGSLGEGGFGMVHHWRHQVTGKEIAIKLLKPNQKLKTDEIDVLKKRWLLEYKWMMSLDTPFIVGAVKLEDNEFLQYLQQQNHWKELPVIVMEYCNGGDLRSVLQRVENANGLPEKEVRDILRALRYAVEYLHKQCNIEHRDIKPENIVINENGLDKVYKLTDFGYAREIPEETIAQSVVGTRHYVAPEVIDPGCYTKTVDYWSVGVMAFEIICGFRPFIPHRDFLLIFTNIRNKPRKCIAITQFLDDPEADRFNFEERIMPQNKCCPIFNGKIENWLCLTLDTDYKKRGYEYEKLQFYNKLDGILNMNIVSVYSLTTCNFFYYDINAFPNIEMFNEALSRDTKIGTNQMYLTLPTGHPKKSLAYIRTPTDFFVAEWVDPYNLDNPPAMLYVSNYQQCDYNVATKEFSEKLPKVIQVCMKTDPANYESVPMWILEQFERQVHYLLSEQHRNVECHMKALFEKIIQIEHEVFMYEQTICQVHEYVVFLNGQVRQFVRTVEKQTAKSGNENPELADKAKMFSKDCAVLREQVATNVVTRYKSVLQHCKALGCNEIYKTLPAKSMCMLENFRRHLDEDELRKLTISQRMKECVKAFDTRMQELTKFSRNCELKNVHNEIFKQFEIFRKCLKAVEDIKTYVIKFENQLDDATADVLQLISMSNNDDISVKLSSLQIDVPHIANNIQSYGVFDPSVKEIINDAHNMLHSIQSVMEIDESIPTTVQDM